LCGGCASRSGGWRWQGLASIGTALVFGSLSVLDLRLPWAWFALCLAAVAGLAAYRGPAAP